MLTVCTPLPSNSDGTFSIVPSLFLRLWFPDSVALPCSPLRLHTTGFLTSVFLPTCESLCYFFVVNWIPPKVSQVVYSRCHSSRRISLAIYIAPSSLSFHSLQNILFFSSHYLVCSYLDAVVSSLIYWRYKPTLYYLLYSSLHLFS